MTRRLAYLVWAVTVAAAAAIAISVASVAATPVRLDGAFCLIALATLCTEALSVDLRVGRHVESYTWAEVTVVIALAVLDPAPLVLTSLAVAVVYLSTRRSLVKVVYNTASHAVGLALAATVAYAIAEPSWEYPTRSAIALIAGAVAFSVWNSLSIDAAIAYSQGLTLAAVSQRGTRLRLAVCTGNITIGLVALTLAHTDPVALFVVPACLALAFVAYRGCLRTIQERVIWRHFESISQHINRLDERAVAEVALTRAAALFEADEVRLCLESRAREGLMHVYVGTAEGVTAGRYMSTAECETCIGEVSGPDESRVGVALLGRHGQIGTLCVVFNEHVTLTEREHHLLRTYSHTISTSIENARLYAEMSEHAARSQEAALHDTLTGLPNRAFLQERARALLERNGDRSFAVMLMDLDHFKDVNDALGHSVGDAVLCEISKRLCQSVRSSDTVCRLGGDEFAILVSDASRDIAIAERVIAVASHPIDVNGVLLGVGGSVGIACYPEDGATFEELLQHADAAMYQAKARRGSLRRYRRDIDDVLLSSKDRLSLVAELQTALVTDQFVVHFQPQLDLSTGEMVGAEALVRWQHPTRGMLAPDEFIGLVEASTLVRQFTCLVLDRAVEECARWQRPGRPLTVAVNLSARNLDDDRLADDVADCLRRHGLAPDRLVLEITETAMLGDRDLVEAQMARLANLGVLLSIDDFGTGNSSLAFLQRVMVHELKIDRAFVAGIVENENDAAITRATVYLAHGLGLRAVAEGVEDPLVARYLAELGCDRAQGYLWGAAMPAADIRKYLCADTEIDLSATVDAALAEQRS